MVVSQELGQVVQKTLSDLQTIKNFQAKRNCKFNINPTDWYVVRKSEVGTAFSDEISAYRTAVRTCYGNLKTAINAASDIDEPCSVYENIQGCISRCKNNRPIKCSKYNIKCNYN